MEETYELIFSIIIFLVVISLLIYLFIFYQRDTIKGPVGPVDNNASIGPTGPTGPSVSTSLGPTGPTGPTGPSTSYDNILLNVEEIQLQNFNLLNDNQQIVPKNVKFGNYYYFSYNTDDNGINCGPNNCDQICNDDDCNNCGTTLEGTDEVGNPGTCFYLNLYYIDEPIIGDFFAVNTIGLKFKDIKVRLFGGKTNSNDNNLVFRIVNTNKSDTTYGNELDTLNVLLQPDNIYYFYYIGKVPKSSNSDATGNFYAVAQSTLVFES